MPDPEESFVIQAGLPIDARRVNPDALRISGEPCYMRLAEPFRFRYEPLPDIAVHELARVVDFLILWATHPHYIDRERWEALGEARRHLPEVRDGAL